MWRNRPERAATFDRAAELYDEVRPGYPEALFDDLVGLSGIRADGRILEIGCGTGKATIPLARRGYHILCLEPGSNLAGIARRNVASFPLAEVQNQSFESWPLRAEAFDLVVAATSFHWVVPEVRYTKTAEALKPGGCVAVFWNEHVLVPGLDRFFEVVQEAYRKHAPEMAGWPSSPQELPTAIDPEFVETGVFEPVAVRHYPWTERYRKERYLNLLQTFSDHIELPAGIRAALLKDIGEIIDGEFGGEIEKHHVAVLQLARRTH